MKKILSTFTATLLGLTVFGQSYVLHPPTLNPAFSNNPANGPTAIGTPPTFGKGSTSIMQLPFVTVSSKGIGNGLSSLMNDGAMFGPDTPGTITCGIQEAINSLPLAMNYYSPGGGRIELGPGIYKVGTTIQTPNNKLAYHLYLDGAGMTACGILYTNTAQPADVLSVSTATNHTATTFKMENMFISSMNNTTNALVYLRGGVPNDTNKWVNLGGVFQAEIGSCWFFYWNSATNFNLTGSTLFAGNQQDDSVVHNLLPVVVDLSLADQVSIHDNIFTFVGSLSVACDHVSLENNNFGWCGGGGNSWPTNSPYCAGASVVFTQPTGGLLNGNEKWWIAGNYFVGNALDYLVNDANKLPHYSYGDQHENASLTLATTGSRWTFVNPDDRSNVASYPCTNNYVVTNTTSFANWNHQPDIASGSNLVSEVNMSRGVASIAGTASLLTAGKAQSLTNFSLSHLLYIDANGNNTNAIRGDPTHPWQTLGTNITIQATNGDIILAGTGVGEPNTIGISNGVSLIGGGAAFSSFAQINFNANNYFSKFTAVILDSSIAADNSVFDHLTLGTYSQLDCIKTYGGTNINVTDCTLYGCNDVDAGIQSSTWNNDQIYMSDAQSGTFNAGMHAHYIEVENSTLILNGGLVTMTATQPASYFATNTTHAFNAFIGSSSPTFTNVTVRLNGPAFNHTALTNSLVCWPLYGFGSGMTNISGYYFDNGVLTLVNGTNLCQPLLTVTNATAPNSTTPVAWLNWTNSSGGVFKIGLCQ